MSFFFTYNGPTSMQIHQIDKKLFFWPKHSTNYPQIQLLSCKILNYYRRISLKIWSFRCRSALDRDQKMKKGEKMKNPDTAAELWFENYDYPINMAIFEHLGSRFSTYGISLGKPHFLHFSVGQKYNIKATKNRSKANHRPTTI